MKRFALALCVPLLAPGFALAAGQTHEAAPMMAPAQKPLTDEDLKEDRAAAQRTESADVIIARFKGAFGDQPPRMAVFWNRAFDDQVSDWSSNTRGVVSTRGSLNGEVPDGNVNLQAQGQAAAQGEYRSNRQKGPAGPAFDLQSGLVSQMVEAGVTVVDPGCHHAHYR